MKYSVISRYDNPTCPKLFRDEAAAYKYYMSSLIDKINKMQNTNNSCTFGRNDEYTLEIFEVEEN